MAGTALGLGGNHNVGLGVGATTVRFLTSAPPSPFLAVMMIWLSCVKTSTQALDVQSATALAGVNKVMNRMRIDKRFMCRHDKWALRLIPVLAGPTVDSCDRLRTWQSVMEMVGFNAPAETSTGASMEQLEF